MSNFLNLNIRCPACGNTDKLDVEAFIWMCFASDTNGGISWKEYHEYTPDSLTLCGACGHSGKLQEFDEDASSHNPVPEVRS
jgi:hypothetical protein